MTMSTPEPGEPGEPDAENRRDTALIRDLADDAITVDGGEPDPAEDAPAEGAGRRLVDSEHRAQMATGSEPNGWFVGPHPDPDRFELLGSGLAGGEGNTWRGRYRGALAAPLTLAVKELRRPPHASPQWPTPADLRRWNDQRALLQYMRIDHLVTVIDIFVGPAPHLPGSARGPSPDTPYVVMEWVPGPTLADEFSGAPASSSTLDERLAHVQHVAEALHSLHSQTASAGNPTLHRDVKPTNCILDPRRGVVLVDVGTMRRMDDGYDHDGFHTPAYTAPEVLANPRAPRSAASDLYSLGALAYFCVVGADPPVPDQPGAGEQVHTRLVAAARSAQVADVTGFVDHLRLMLDPLPHQRPSDAMSWSRRLRSLAALRGRRPSMLSSRRARVLTGSGVVAAAVAVGAFCAVWLIQERDNTGQTAAVGLPGGNARTGPSVAPSVTFSPPPADGGPGPGRGATGPLPSATPAGPDGLVKSTIAAITAPQSGRPAPLCTLVTGTSKLPAGQTLLTAVENLEFGDQVRHLQPIRGWEQPAALNRWEGVQFIGLPHDVVGTRFRIEVIMAPLAALKQQIIAAGGEHGPWRAQIPPNSTVVASVYVTRGSGGTDDPRSCGRP